MAVWVPEACHPYVWRPKLGGRLRKVPDSKHIALRNDSFRADADHMETDEFAKGVEELLALAAEAPIAVMCSEAVWWRCHRRLLADPLLGVRGVAVVHLMHDVHTTTTSLSSVPSVPDSTTLSGLTPPTSHPHSNTAVSGTPP